jgi:hypothetical protein
MAFVFNADGAAHATIDRCTSTAATGLPRSTTSNSSTAGRAAGRSSTTIRHVSGATRRRDVRSSWECA